MTRLTTKSGDALFFEINMYIEATPTEDMKWATENTLLSHLIIVLAWEVSLPWDNIIYHNVS